MNDRLERASSVAITVAALAIAGATAHREFATPRYSSAGFDGPPTWVNSWQQIANSGHRFGAPNGPITVIEFADLECPGCRGFNQALQQAERRYPGKITRAFVHYPLRMHRFARPAARVVECAATQGRFVAMHDLLYAKQDSLGLKSWSSYAREAGVPDSVRFARCASDTSSVPLIETDVRLGDELGVHATPTVIVNGWRYATPPDSAKLSQAIDALLAGRTVPGAKG